MKQVVIAVGVVLACAMVMAEDAKKDETKTTELKPQTTCPVMGGTIDKSIYVDYDGKRIYLCCPACIDAMTKDPAKYVKQLESEGVKLDKIQTACPISGEEIDKKMFADYNGKRVYFCCAACVQSFNKEPDKYIKKLEDQGITLDRTPTDASKKKDAKKAADGK